MSENKFRDVSIEEFSSLKFISPASKAVWGIENVLKKLKRRSVINAEESAEISYDRKGVGDFGDVDLTASISITLASVWTQSPTITLNADVPFHITGNGDWKSGFVAGINDVICETVYYSGNLYLVADGNQDANIMFNFSDFTSEQQAQVMDFILSVIWQRQKKEVLRGFNFKEA